MNGTKGVKRVKTGCITCRVRRVKCDEEHPHCRRCTSTGRECDGYSTLPFSRKDLQAASRSVSPHPTTLKAAFSQADLIPRLVTDPAFGDLAEKRYFQFFRQKTVISNNNLIDNRFWDRIVLQACHNEPAIKHAVLALSCLHQLSQLSPGTDAFRKYEAYAERQHQKALVAAQQLISTSQAHDFDKILAACVIFILFESVRGDYKAAAIHMSSGRAILAQHSERLKRPERRKDLLEIEHALGRLDLAAVSFSDSSSPNLFSVQNFHSTWPSTIPYAFEDLHDAQTCLVDLCRWLLVLAHHVYHAERRGDLHALAKYQAEKVRCGDQLARWQVFWRDFVERATSPPELVLLNLRIWHSVAMLVVKAESYGPETRYDAFIPDFEAIISSAEIIATKTQTTDPTSMFSYEIGYLIPVYVTATRCRDPALRRRAIAVLRDYPRQEGVAESTAAAALAEVWMNAEEEGMDVKRAGDVPEEMRLASTDLKVDVRRGEAVVCLKPQDTGWQEDVVATWRRNENGKGHHGRRQHRLYGKAHSYKPDLEYISNASVSLRTVDDDSRLLNEFASIQSRMPTPIFLFTSQETRAGTSTNHLDSIHC